MKIQSQIMSNADKQIHTTKFQSHIQKEVRLKHNDFSVAHFNVRGVTSKLDQIKDLLDQIKDLLDQIKDLIFQS